MRSSLGLYELIKAHYMHAIGAQKIQTSVQQTCACVKSAGLESCLLLLNSDSFSSKYYNYRYYSKYALWTHISEWLTT